MRKTVALGFCTALAACGSPVEKGDYKPVLGSINGQISLDTSVTLPDAPIRVALLWQNVNSGTPPYLANVAQDIGVSSKFPIEFELDLTDPPPKEAIWTTSNSGFDLQLDPALTWTQGTVIVYADNNRNGKLDLATSAAMPSPDQVLGAADNYTVFYVVSGTPAPLVDKDGVSTTGILPVVAGVSIVSGEKQIDPGPGDCSEIDPSTGQASLYLCSPYYDTTALNLLPANAPLPITLSNDPKIAGYSCATYLSDGDWPDWEVAELFGNQNATCTSTTLTPGCACSGSNCPLDLPPSGVSIACSSDNSSYVYKTCKADANLCNTNVCHFGTGAIVPGSTPPANWPCPAP